MKFTVLWIPEAEAELARLWTGTRTRAIVTHAVDAIDQVLRIAPDEVGESRDGNRRIFFAWPLAVTYVIKHDDRIVQINKVWRYE